MNKGMILFLTTSMLILSTSCTTQASSSEKQKVVTEACCVKPVPMPEWSKDAIIYEVNVRQYTPEGTFNAFSKSLPRLKAMGVKILWIMPIHPIGEVNRKGELGSYYAAKDYKAISKDYGSLNDFKALVNEAHKLDMKVIIDWVANHTSWDSKWVTEHPDWYTHDGTGKIVAPIADWKDVADLNYNNKDMRAAMADAMLYWVKEADIDGFRCDVAGMVSADFWNDTRAKLDSVKPVFMLAEDETTTALFKHAFNANYGWNMHSKMNQIAQGKRNAMFLKGFFAHQDSVVPVGLFSMQFTSNHDENSWNKSEYSRMGNAATTMAALTFVIPGMPLIYSGQEAGNKKSLNFFDRDPIDFSSLPLSNFYKQLSAIKVKNEALWNGSYGAPLIEIKATPENSVFAFSRTKGRNEIVAVFNLSPISQTVSTPVPLKGIYTNALTGEVVELPLTAKAFAAWEYLILIKK